MKTAKEITENLIARAKSMQEFRIVRQLDDADIIFSAGVVPFDIKIKNGIATVSVPALTESEARSKIIAYFNNSNEED